jgi:D-3-phosphoglycerate dehydrogenase
MRCLIADDLHPVLPELLTAAGIHTLYLPEVEKDEFVALLANTEILVIRSRFQVDRQLLEKAPQLRIIGRAGAGLDGIDVSAAEDRGIIVLHAAEGNADAVGEHVLGMILGLLARIPEADRKIRQGIWDREGFRGRELNGRCVGIIGYGNMGPAVARRLSSFGCRIISYDKYRTDWPDQFAERVDLDEIKRSADILSLHVPLTTETTGLIHRDFLLGCKPGLLLINTSRGPVLDVSGLEQLLDTGSLSGIGLDVFPEEPLYLKNFSGSSETEKLIQRPDVLATPHVAGWTLESYEKISRVLAEKIIRQKQVFSELNQVRVSN